MTACVLCYQIGIGQLIAEIDHAVAFFDSYLLNPGRALVVPHQHTVALFDIDIDPDARARSVGFSRSSARAGQSRVSTQRI